MAAVLQPASGLGDVQAEPQARNQMDSVTAVETENFLTQQMINILRETGYDQSAINTLITRADSNTISTNNVPPHDLTNIKSIGNFLEENLLNAADLRKQNIDLNSNEPILLLGYSNAPDLSIHQIRELNNNVLTALRDRGIKPVRVYIRETGSKGDDTGLKFSLLNVVNSDIGVNMVSLLDVAFYGGAWKQHLVAIEAYNGYDLIWKDEAWKSREVETEPQFVAVVDATVEPEAEPQDQTTNDRTAPWDDKTEKQAEDEATAAAEAPKEPLTEMHLASEVRAAPTAVVRPAQYKSADDIPEDSDDGEEAAPVQHPALKELLETEAQKPEVQHPTWSRTHDREAYLDIIKTHSGGVEEKQPVSVISHPSDGEKDDFELVDRP